MKPQKEVAVGCFKLDQGIESRINPPSLFILHHLTLSRGSGFVGEGCGSNAADIA